ncbi:MAG: Uma2 family endonuclease [Polyangiaceae bacterium]|nr:Uma2 family endonuclease [Polyangiaceae bacterium]
MNEPARKLSASYPEYLAQEQASETKHEFLSGEIFAMAGGTPEHARLSSRVIGALVAQLRGRPCEAFSSDLRVRVLATSLVTYPDVSVVCGRFEQDPEDANTLVNPVVLVEVLSDSSEAYDRGEKFAHYRRIPSLQEYVLISQRKPRIEVFRRNEDGTWMLFEAEASGSVKLASIGCELSVDEVYANALGAAG